MGVRTIVTIAVKDPETLLDNLAKTTQVAAPSESRLALSLPGRRP